MRRKLNLLCLFSLLAVCQCDHQATHHVHHGHPSHSQHGSSHGPQHIVAVPQQIHHVQQGHTRNPKQLGGLDFNSFLTPQYQVEQGIPYPTATGVGSDSSGYGHASSGGHHQAQGHSTYSPTQPSYKSAAGNQVPHCARNLTYSFCLEDYEYPQYELIEAIKNHQELFNQLYADVADQGTRDSVEKLKKIEEEVYLCPSETLYIKPKRARNAEGYWRIIVQLDKGYEPYSQTVRVEKCLDQTRGKPCPLVPDCYGSRCLQKSFYHRFLTFDPYSKYPFAMEIFPLPGSCGCVTEEFIHETPVILHKQHHVKQVPVYYPRGSEE